MVNTNTYTLGQIINSQGFIEIIITLLLVIFDDILNISMSVL